MRKTVILVLLKTSLHFEQIKQETICVAGLWSVRTGQDEKTCSRLHLGRAASQEPQAEGARGDSRSTLRGALELRKWGSEAPILGSI